MNRIIRAFAAFIVSICLILAPAVSYAASSWSITSAISAGARTIVSASNGGYKAAVNIAPSAARLAGTVLKRGNQAYMVYAIAQLLGSGVDYVLDPENNRVKYKDPIEAGGFIFVDTQTGSTGTVPSSVSAAGAAAVSASSGRSFSYDYTNCLLPVGSATQDCYAFYKDNTDFSIQIPLKVRPVEPADTPYKYLSATQVAAQVLNNASSGHSPSQAAVRETAIEMVVTGDFDRDFLQGAVPTSDNRPLIPSVPGNQNGNVTPGTDPGVEGATPGTQADAAKAAADAAKAAADAAADAAKDAQEQAAKDAADAQDLINSAADQAAIDAANARAAAAEKAAADSKAVADRAAQAAADAAKAADRAAAQAAAQAAVDAANARAAADAAIAAVKAAAEADKAAAQAAADAAVRAADAAKAEAEARAKAAEEAAKAADKAKAEAAKPFELPAFCSWATKVCDFVDWVKADPQLEEPPEFKPEIQDLTKYDTVDISQNYITASGQCPAAADLNINFGVVKLSYEPLCIILDKLSGVIVAVAYISVGFMIVRTV